MKWSMQNSLQKVNCTKVQEQINKPSVSLASKTMGKLGGGLGLVLQTVRGIVQGKHKKRRIFKKEGS